MDINDLFIKLFEQSPIVAILGFIAYRLRQDLHEYMERCSDDNKQLLDKIFALLERINNK